MGDGDPRDTQKYPPSPAAELADAGFDEVQEIGRGGFGVVYRCIQRDLDRTVAVKVLTVDLDEENRARFFREQRAMGRLTGHPNIVNILQVGVTASGLPYLVMPYHRQDSLDVRIRRHGPLSLDQALRLGVKMAGALESAHRLGIVHRDAKPANILLTEYGEPQLADFGIAHIAGGFETATGAVTGSPAYTAPEVLSGDPPRAAADIYGLGATLFSALTGHAAFERRSSEQVVAQFLRITTHTAPDLREHGIPEDVSDTIARAMARTPDQRPATAADFGEELRALQRAHGFPVDEMALRAEPDADASVDSEDGSPGPALSHRRRITAPVMPSITGSLPSELTSFVGRRHELAEAKNLLGGSRLLTLTGIGGGGKTRLAIRFAAAVQRDYADGVRLVELGELRDGAALLGAVAAAVRLRDRSNRPMLEMLVEFLAPRQMLVVIDNCEHLIDAVADLVDRLLRGCPQVRILATSREPLGLPGEAVLHVPPMTVPDSQQPPSMRTLSKYDAVKLFAERAAATVPGFVLTEDNAATVVRICRRLDGLPLPIELAAARLRALSPEQILDRLTDRYNLLTRAHRGVPTRQQTLRWCIDWSFELCTAVEQLVWGRAAVFGGSFDLDAAEQVCGEGLGAGEMLDTLTALVDKSILIREETGSVVRFRMLETLRAYGIEKLEQSGEDMPVRRRHRDWYEAMVLAAEIEWVSDRQLAWIARLKRELPNLREILQFNIDDDPAAGLRSAVALFPFWASQGLYEEARRWYDRLLARQDGPPTLEWAKALYGASMMANIQGDFATGTALVEQGRMLAAQTTDPVIRAFVSFADGMLGLLSGDLEHACSHLESALAQFSESGGRRFEMEVLVALGTAYGLSDLTEQAIECHERVLEITDKHREKMYRTYSLWALGVILWQQGNADRAVRLLEESLEMSRQVRNPRGVAASLEALAWISVDQRDARRAAVLMGAADRLAQEVGISPVVHLTLVVHHEECARKTRQTLGNKAFESAHRQGAQFGFDAAIAFALQEHPPAASMRDTEASARLTKRERQVADLISEGLTNQAIARRLVISPRTAQSHVEHILAKLGFTSRAQVAAWVAEQAHD